MEDVAVNSTEELAEFLESVPDNVVVMVSFGEEKTSGGEK